MDLDQRLARSRIGARDVDDLEHFRAAVSIDAERLHATTGSDRGMSSSAPGSPSGSRRAMSSMSDPPRAPLYWLGAKPPTRQSARIGL